MSWSLTKKLPQMQYEDPQKPMQRILMSISAILKEMLDLLVLSKDT